LVVTDPLGVVRDLPAGVAGAALLPPVTSARAFPDLQDDPEDGGIGRVPVLAVARVAEGGGSQGRADTTVGGLLIDCEEDRIPRAVLVGMLREAKRR
jgi:hypothetical protein